MNKGISLGMLTPSSNAALKPITSAMISGLPKLRAHLARLPVTEISLSKPVLEQFDIQKMLQARAC